MKLELDASWKWGLACSVGLNPTCSATPQMIRGNTIHNAETMSYETRSQAVA